MNKKMITYIFMHVLFLSGSWVKAMEVEPYIPHYSIYKCAQNENYLYRLSDTGSFFQLQLDAPEDQRRMYYAKLVATDDGFFVQANRMSNTADSEISTKLFSLPLKTTRKQNKSLLQELQSFEENHFIFVMDNSNNSYKITRLECTVKSSSENALSSSSSSKSWH